MVISPQPSDTLRLSQEARVLIQHEGIVEVAHRG